MDDCHIKLELGQLILGQLIYKLFAKEKVVIFVRTGAYEDLFQLISRWRLITSIF
jgi:mRNA-degrading endonuclease YafQ of YafQ-DinJ toxin-antitoxin module